MPRWPCVAFALAAGSVDLGSAATSAVVNSIAGGNDFVAAYPSNGINDQVQSVFYVLEDSPIKGIKDIVGKSIAVNTLGAHLDYTVREALHQNGLPEDAVKLVVVPGPQLADAAPGQVDIAGLGYWQATFEGLLKEHGGVRGIFDDTDILGEIAGGLVLRRDFIEAHPQAAKDFVKQAQRAAEWSRENPEEARKAIAGILEKRARMPNSRNTGLASVFVRARKRQTAILVSGSMCSNAKVKFRRASSRRGSAFPA
jgi:ABC-type nitrate/sulfonate/bicarbonate transport system substrate-binding protein